MTTITVNDELRAYIDPLTPEELQALERSILAEGCRDALVLWGEVLVDGHNRFRLCQKHGLPFQTVQNTRFTSMDDVHLWMIDQHLGRRSVSDFQRGVLALRKKDIVASRVKVVVPVDSPEAAALPAPEKLNTRESIAKAARISSATVVQIEKIQKSAAPELVEAVKQGTISINAAAAVASLPNEEQIAAVAGGKKEMQQAAKRVRDGGREEKKTAPRPTAEAEDESLEDQVKRLKQEIAELTAENESLKKQLGASAF